MGTPTVYPTGTTIYKPDLCWNSFTLFHARGRGAMLIDMNGREVHCWENVCGFPDKLLPDGSVLTADGENLADQGQVRLLRLGWNGEVLWSYNGAADVAQPDGTMLRMARQHHDLIHGSFPAPYYTPQPFAVNDHVLLLCHANVERPEISDLPLLDDRLVELDADNNVVWDWFASDHFDELGFDAAAKAAIRRHPASGSDWFHINCVSQLGPNKWFDAGDTRFHPDNLILDSRQTNILFIIERSSGRIVWRVGPDYSGEPARKLGWIIGQHHCHMIPQGLPGAGNILVFDNGGEAGYGAPNAMSETGTMNVHRAYSRVLEFDPTTLDLVWSWQASRGPDSYRFFSPLISDAQRLPNGNTFINEGTNGRFFEVTPAGELVWEYVAPYVSAGEHINCLGPVLGSSTYRAYRVPYEWTPIETPPVPVPIEKPRRDQFHVPGTPELVPVPGVHAKF